MLGDITHAGGHVFAVVGIEGVAEHFALLGIGIGVVDGLGDGNHALIAAVVAEVDLVHHLILGTALDIYIGGILDFDPGRVEAAEVDGEVFIFAPDAYRLPFSAIDRVDARSLDGQRQCVFVVVIDFGLGENFAAGALLLVHRHFELGSRLVVIPIPFVGELHFSLDGDLGRGSLLLGGFFVFFLRLFYFGRCVKNNQHGSQHGDNTKFHSG